MAMMAMLVSPMGNRATTVTDRDSVYSVLPAIVFVGPIADTGKNCDIFWKIEDGALGPD
jgi:hypothetical protein